MSLVLGHPYAQALAWALIHFVWQGAAIALALIAVQRASRLSPSARYTSGVIAMAVMLAAPALTFVRLTATAPVDPVASSAVTPADIASLAALPAANTPIDPSTPTPLMPAVVVAIWACGVIALSVRLFGGWIVARRMARRALAPASAEVRALARRVAGRLALDRVVDVFESSAVSVPVMIGWVKPVVLLPAAAISGLSIAQVEALLAHELAHVRRHDYLVNLLQSAVETLLFYHPAVWFVSRRMRIDREHCCDDLAVGVCDRVVYATALSDLAALITTTPRVALAATDGSLSNRVRRILGQPAAGHDSGSAWISACLVVLLVGSVAPVVLTQDKRPDTSKSSIQDGVQGGVPGGVQGGAAGGVAQGAAGGVSGGVPGGVVGGVVAGVPAGVPNGVAGGVPDKIVEAQSPESQSQAAAAQAEQAKQRALEDQLRQLSEELQKIARAREDLELQRTEAQSKARLVELESQLQVLRNDEQRLGKLVAAGNADKSQFADIAAKISAVQGKIEAERTEMAFQKMDVDLRRRAKELESEAVRAKLEGKELVGKSLGEEKLKQRALEELAQKVKELDDLNALSQQEKAKFELDQMAQLLSTRSLKAELATAELESSVPAAAGDFVFVSIQSEPDLPRNYVVQPDGTIRFPFLGVIKVQGMTAKQIQDTITKQLADRKLAAASSVNVTLRRAAVKK